MNVYTLRTYFYNKIIEKCGQEIFYRKYLSKNNIMAVTWLIKAANIIVVDIILQKNIYSFGISKTNFNQREKMAWWSFFAMGGVHEKNESLLTV